MTRGKPRTHWAGGAHVVRGHRVIEYMPGWPCCCSGDMAGRLTACGRTTRKLADVTCERCLAVLALPRAGR